MIILSGVVSEIASPVGHFLPIDCHQQIYVEISNVAGADVRSFVASPNNELSTVIFKAKVMMTSLISRIDAKSITHLAIWDNFVK